MPAKSKSSSGAKDKTASAGTEEAKREELLVVVKTADGKEQVIEERIAKSNAIIKINFNNAIPFVRKFLEERLQKTGIAVSTGNWQSWWGDMDSTNLRNIGCVIGRKYIDAKEGELAAWRLDWEPSNRGDKGIHYNLELTLKKTKQVYALKVETTDDDKKLIDNKKDKDGERFFTTSQEKGFIKVRDAWAFWTEQELIKSKKMPIEAARAFLGYLEKSKDAASYKELFPKRTLLEIQQAAYDAIEEAEKNQALAAAAVPLTATATIEAAMAAAYPATAAVAAAATTGTATAAAAKTDAKADNNKDTKTSSSVTAQPAAAATTGSTTSAAAPPAAAPPTGTAATLITAGVSPATAASREDAERAKKITATAVATASVSPAASPSSDKGQTVQTDTAPTLRS
jgi:hypothetical protein